MSTLVTGATDGIGRQTALELARRGQHVIVHGRSAKKVDGVVAELTRESGGRVDGVVADFARLSEVKNLAAEASRRFPDLNILINNAGLYAQSRMETEDGFESTFQVNHLAPFLLTLELLPLLERNAPARIINVSSTAHQSGSLDLSDLNSKRGYSGYGAYAASKLANILFTRELAERLDPGRVTVNSLHPGVIGTKLLRAGFGGMSGDSWEAGARTSVFLATAPEVASVTGRYFVRERESSVSSAAQDRTAQKELWELSEKLVAQAAGRT